MSKNDVAAVDVKKEDRDHVVETVEEITIETAVETVVEEIAPAPVEEKAEEVMEEMIEDVEEKKVETVEKISPAPTDEESKKAESVKRGTAVNSRYVQVRRTPSSSAQVVTIMNAGDKATILDRVSGFYKIETEKGKHIGFVASQYFTEG